MLNSIHMNMTGLTCEVMSHVNVLKRDIDVPKNVTDCEGGAALK